MLKQLILSALLTVAYMIANGQVSPLKDKYKNFFSIGVAVYQEKEMQDSDLITRHFNTIVAKQDLQPMRIHTAEEKWNWAPADKIVDFAQRHHLKTRGVCLVYGIHMKSWFFRNKENNWLNKDSLLTRMERHITTEVSRYRGKVYCWDVVNEALRANDTMLQLCGEEYIDRAFRAAHKADTAAELFYNDDIKYARDWIKIFGLIKRLRQRGVPIDGVGIQGHIGSDGFDEAAYQSYIDQLHQLGLTVEFTEVDVSVYGRKRGNHPPKGTDDTFTNLREQQQADLYGKLFRFFRKNRDKISGVTLWGLSDKDGTNTFLYSKKNNLRNYPYLFDGNNQPKKAFFAISSF